MIADDLKLASIVQLANIVLAVGWLDDNVYCEISDDNGVSKREFRDGSTRKLIAAGAEEQPSLVVLSTGEIIASLTRASQVISYLGWDWGEHWVAVDTVS